MTQTLSLYRLQQIDSQVERHRARLAAIAERLSEDEELRLAVDRARAAETACRQARSELAAAERAVEAQRVKIEQTEASLYGGAVRNPKELQDLQMDVASLRRHLATLEDRQLEAMLAAEAAEAAEQTARAEAQRLQEGLEAQNEGLLREQESLQRDVERLRTEHGAALESVSQEAIDLYDRLRQQRRGVAVASIVEDSCQACGSGLTPAQVQAARSGTQMALCPSCGRILYGS
jgi:predicted  nucleic acid-binding Zn-ribbon protein